MTATSNGNGSSPDTIDDEAPVEDTIAEDHGSTDTEADDTSDVDTDADTGDEDEARDESDVESDVAIVDQPDEDRVADTAPPSPPPAPTVDPVVGPGSDWTTGQLASVLLRAAAVCLALALIGFGLGVSRGATHVARSEFVYTLDESVPDSFLREDRRLLTQVATFTSDAVLQPVARQFELDTDELRAAIDIETVALSEVLRLEVTDADPGRALALNRAIVDQYLMVIGDAAPAGDSRELTQRRTEVLAELAVADEQRIEIQRIEARDAELAVQQDSIQRRIDLTRDRLFELQSFNNDAIAGQLSAARSVAVSAELERTVTDLAGFEAELSAVAGERAQLATGTVDELALNREIERLESQLRTIDEELSQRELGPLVASPIRELSEPLTIERSAVRSGVQTAAIGALIGVPLAAWVAYRARRRQLWTS